jgi:hypothetical protein
VVLMEVVLALALIVTIGMAVLSAVSQSTGALKEARERQVGVDLARSAMAKLEAGLESTTTLSGPVPAWSEDVNLAEMSDEWEETGWELLVEAEPSGFEGLTYVSVTARRVREFGGEDDAGGISFTLRQLVRLAQKDEEGIGEKDDVTLEAEKALERGGGRRDRRGRDAEEEGEP